MHFQMLLSMLHQSPALLASHRTSNDTLSDVKTSSMAPKNVPAIEIGIVQSVESPFHSFASFELDHAFIPRLFVGVGVRHFTRLTHVIFQILPE